MHSTLVSFGVKQRALGEGAKTQEISNYKNTIGSLNRLIGRSLNDTEIQEVEKKFLTCTLIDVGGTVGVKVSAMFIVDEGELMDFSG
jgi:heat shock protein 4